MVRYIVASLIWLLVGAATAHADSIVVPSCGVLPQQYAVGSTRIETMDINGNRCNTSGTGGTSQIFPAVNGGQLEVWTQPKKWFFDDFGVSTLNIINKWTNFAAVNGAVQAANGACPGASCGAAVMGTGTTANGQSVLQSQLFFPPRNPGYFRFQANINLPNPNTVNQYLSWGFSNITTATPGLTAANPCGTANSGAAAAAFGFSLTGKLQAFTCASGNFLLIADLSQPQGAIPIQTSSGIWTGGCSCTPQEPDTQSYKYVIDFIGYNIIWYTEQADGTLRRVAFITRGAAGPDINDLPVTFVALGGSTPPASSSNIQINAVEVGDTAGNPISAVHTVTSGTTANPVLKASQGSLISVTGTCNNGATACSLIVFNSATAIAAATTPTYGTASGNAQDCINIPANTTAGINYYPQPYEQFSVGIAVFLSGAACSAATAATSAASQVNGVVE